MINQVNNGLNSVNTLYKANNQINKAQEKIASGLSINRAADGAAELTISEKLRALQNQFNQQRYNEQDYINYNYVKDSSLSSIQDQTQRIRELSLQASNGTLTDSDRGLIQEEINQLKEGIKDIRSNSNFNTIKVIENLNIDNLDKIDVSTQEKANASIDSSDKFIEELSSNRALVGAEVNRSEHRIENLYNQEINITSAESQIRDADIANETLNLSQGQILSSSSISAISDSISSSNVNSLL